MCAVWLQGAASVTVGTGILSQNTSTQACSIAFPTSGTTGNLIAGTVTNFCCETSARDAMMLDYRVVMVSDACAARYDEDHIVGLTSVWQSFGDVRAVDDCVQNLLQSS